MMSVCVTHWQLWCDALFLVISFFTSLNTPCFGTDLLHCFVNYETPTCPVCTLVGIRLESKKDGCMLL